MGKDALYPTALEDCEIRLLQILPAQDPDQIIESKLLTYHTNSAPAYWALSYVWGSPKNQVDILCNEETIQVNLNLHDAMQKLRQEDEPIELWADALCINQNNVSEKNRHVPLMKEVYFKASLVMVWMGNADDEVTCAAELAFHTIWSRNEKRRAELAEAKNACREDSGAENDDNTVGHVEELASQQRAREHPIDLMYQPLVDIGLSRFQSTIPDGGYQKVNKLLAPPKDDLKTTDFDDVSWDAMKQFYAQKWLTRIWCVQEIHMAQRACVLWGNAKIAWKWIVDTSRWLSVRSIAGDRSPLQQSFSTANRMDSGNITKGSLLSLMSRYRNFKATLPHDQIYALLGILTSDAERAVVPVDYAKHHGEVYSETAAGLIRRNMDLDSLLFVCHPETYRETEHFKSWAPRWDKMLPFGSIGLYRTLNPTAACKDLHVQFTEGSPLNLTQLPLRGLLFDTVTSVAAAFHVEPPYGLQDMMISHLDLWDNVLSDYVPGTPEYWAAVQKIGRTLTCGFLLHSAGLVSEADNEMDRHDFYASFVQYIIAMFKMFERESPYKPSYPMRVSEKVSPNYMKEHILGFGLHRRLFRTTDGSYGLGPACMREGDVVVVLFGGDVPFVLRPKGGDEYLFMGQTYVDDIMRGELVDRMRALEIKAQNFCLV